MIMMFIALLVAVLSFNVFMMSYQMNGINRLVLSMPITLVEASINFIKIDEMDGPYFDKNLLEENVNAYYDYHLPRYSNDYQIGFYYYNVEDHSFDLDEKYNAVEVSIDAGLILMNRYQKTMHYEIRGH